MPLGRTVIVKSDTPVRPEGSGRRGPLPRHPRRRPTGFRIDDQTRLELEVAVALFGTGSLQGVLDIAVTEYLEPKHHDTAFVRAVEEAGRRRRR